jgi:hypothetical protein
MLKRFYNRPWVGSWLQRFGAWVLSWFEPEYLGPTERSYRPRPTPRLFREKGE